MEVALGVVPGRLPAAPVAMKHRWSRRSLECLENLLVSSWWVKHTEILYQYVLGFAYADILFWCSYVEKLWRAWEV